MSILEDLWNGEICPIASGDYGTAEYHELGGLLERNQKKLLPTLDPEQQEALQKIEDIWEDMERISQCSAFITGFRLAVQIMTASI